MIRRSYLLILEKKPDDPSDYRAPTFLESCRGF